MKCEMTDFCSDFLKHDFLSGKREFIYGCGRTKTVRVVRSANVNKSNVLDVTILLHACIFTTVILVGFKKSPSM